VLTPTIREVVCVDLVDTPLEDFAPRDPKSFQLALQVFVEGDDGESGTERLQLIVATPEWMAGGEVRTDIWPWYFVVVSAWDWTNIHEYLEIRVTACSGRDWDAVLDKLSQWTIVDGTDREPNLEWPEVRLFGS
jgi:hypothetical protein